MTRRQDLKLPSEKITQQAANSCAMRARRGGRRGASTLAAPYVKAQSADQVAPADLCRPGARRACGQESIDAFNKAANGEMEIELYTADQLVPQGELFRAVQNGTSMPRRATTTRRPRRSTSRCSAPISRSPRAISLDVPALWHWYGLKEIWEEAYAEVPGVTWLSTGAWDPCTSSPPSRSKAGRPEGPARLHLPDRRPVPVALRRRAGVAAL